MDTVLYPLHDCVLAILLVFVLHLQLFVELNELIVEKDHEMRWKERARWIKFEEDVEEETDRWGKPHVASLSFRSLLELRRTITQGKRNKIHKDKHDIKKEEKLFIFVGIILTIIQYFPSNMLARKKIS